MENYLHCFLDNTNNGSQDIEISIIERIKLKNQII